MVFPEEHLRAREAKEHLRAPAVAGSVNSQSNYSTRSITWDDCEEETDARSAKEAAIEHATRGWDNDNVDDNQRNDVIIRVSAPDDEVTYWLVQWKSGAAVASNRSAQYADLAV